VPFFEPLEERALMSTTYYVSPSGNDSNSGTSINSPWKSVGKVSNAHLNAGDHVLFQGGQTFGGTLELYEQNGASNAPIVISSYGSGQATISSGTGRGAYLLNDNYVTLSNLKFQGSPGSTTSQDGVRIENYAGNSVKYGDTVTGCTITGYAEGGIIFGGDSSNEGLSGVSLTYNTICNDVMTGIESYSVNSQSNTNIYIGYNQIYNIYGDGESSVNGSGIMLEGMNGCTVEHNSVHDNGSDGNGNVGIWAYSSNDVIFQYNESYNNMTHGADDGDGFDFDADVSNSIMQYNVAANNEGGGFELFQWHNDNSQTNDIIRYNVAQDNAWSHNYSQIDVWGKVINAQIYNNTVYTTQARSGQTSAIRISNNTITNLFPSNIYIANNIFSSSGSTPLVDFYSAALRGASNVVFAGNVYYSYSGSPDFAWGGNNYSSLSSWHSATGQETLNGQATGEYANPQLSNPGNAVPQPSAANLSSVTAAYDLQASTPILNAGVTLNSLFNVASPLTGVSSKTIPGIDQSLAGKVSSGSGSSTSAPTSTTPGSVSSSYLAGWDIGNPNAGSNSESGSTDIITGGGSGVLSGSSDSFRYAWTTLTGNGQITSQVTSMSNSASTAAAGLMIRSSTAANAADVSLLFNPSHTTVTFAYRSSNGGSVTTRSFSANGAQWIKLVRSGNTFEGYLSTNGDTWTEVASETVAMGNSTTIGLASTAGKSGTTETTTFRNVAFAGD
jgi:hypothetical protein